MPYRTTHLMYPNALTCCSLIMDRLRELDAPTAFRKSVSEQPRTKVGRVRVLTYDMQYPSDIHHTLSEELVRFSSPISIKHRLTCSRTEQVVQLRRDLQLILELNIDVVTKSLVVLSVSVVAMAEGRGVDADAVRALPVHDPQVQAVVFVTSPAGQDTVRLEDLLWIS